MLSCVEEIDVVGRFRQGAVVGVAAVAVFAVIVGGQVASAQQEAQTAASVEDLLQRLDDLEVQLPATPPPTSVTVPDDATWGAVEGDFTGVRAQLTTLEPDLRRLFIDADATHGEVADAIANVARGWLLLWEGYESLAAWETNDLAFPLDTTDDDGVATGADDLRGLAEHGLALVLEGRERHLDGYVALREQGPAEPAAQARLDARADQAETFHAEVRPLIHRLRSLPTTQLLVPVERFTSQAPGIEARARSFTMTCVERDDYQAAAGDFGGTPLSGPDGVSPALAAAAARAPSTPDCPDLPEGATLTPGS